MPIYRAGSPVDVIYRGGVQVDRVYRGGSLVWSRPVPVRQPIAETTAIGASAHSFLDTATGVEGGHGGILNTIWTGTIHQTFAGYSTEQTRYDLNGPDRTATYAGPLIIALYGDVAAGQMWGPASPEGITQYATCVSYAQEAAAMGRDSVVLYVPWTPESVAPTQTLIDQTNARVEALRQHIRSNANIPVWVIPAHLLVAEALDYYPDNVYRDGLHLQMSTDTPSRHTPEALSWMVYMWLTMQQHSNPADPTDLAHLKAAAWSILTGDEWTGMSSLPAPAAEYGDGQITINGIPAPPTYNVAYGEGEITISEA